MNLEYKAHVPTEINRSGLKDELETDLELPAVERRHRSVLRGRQRLSRVAQRVSRYSQTVYLKDAVYVKDIQKLAERFEAKAFREVEEP